jgi:hypothetical protein
MTYPKNVDLEPMNAAVATEYVRKMVALEDANAERAMEKLQAKYGLSYWTLDHFRRRKAKTCEVTLFAHIKAAFIDHCGKQAARLIHEAQTAQAVNYDDDVAAIEDEIRALAARLALAKSKAKRAA